MPSTAGDLEEAVISLPDTKVCTLKLMLEQGEFSQAVLNTACQKAMSLEKIKFVALLLYHGATPSPSELVQRMIRFCEHPMIQWYLSGLSTDCVIYNSWSSTLCSEEWSYDYASEKVIIIITDVLNFNALLILSVYFAGSCESPY